MKLRVGFLTLHLKLGYGVDLVVDRSARELYSRGYQVTVYTCKVEPLYDEAPYTMVVLDESRGFLTAPFSAAFLKRCQSFLCEEAIDLWIVHSPPFDRKPIAFPGKVLYWEHGTPPGSFFEGVQGPLLDWTTWFRHHKVYQFLPPDRCQVVAISSSIAEELPPAVRNRTTVIYNGVDHYERQNETQRTITRAQLGVAADSVLIAAVGRLELEDQEQPYKGLTDLLAMAEAWSAANPNLQVLVAGRCSGRTIEELNRRGILTAAHVSNEALPSLYQAVDVVVSTSRWEGFNLPLLEAQYQGTPVVAYRLGPHQEVVADGSSGLLADSQEDFIAKVMRLVDAPDLRVTMGKSARDFSAQFRWRHHGDSLDRFLQQWFCLSRSDSQAATPLLNAGSVSGQQLYSLPSIGALVYRLTMVWWFLRYRGPSTALALLGDWIGRKLSRLGKQEHGEAER